MQEIVFPQPKEEKPVEVEVEEGNEGKEGKEGKQGKPGK